MEPAKPESDFDKARKFVYQIQNITMQALRF